MVAVCTGPSPEPLHYSHGVGTDWLQSDLGGFDTRGLISLRAHHCSFRSGGILQLRVVASSGCLGMGNVLVVPSSCSTYTRPRSFQPCFCWWYCLWLFAVRNRTWVRRASQSDVGLCTTAVHSDGGD